MKRFIVSVALFVAATELGTVGCNAILGNEPGILSSDATVTTCASDQKQCGTACVSLNDPNVGCGGPCSVCTTPVNGQAACELQNSVETCSLGACNAQFGDCDSNKTNGCETHTTTRANCGTCGNDCLQDFCERQGTGYACSATCDPPNLPCGPDGGAECIDPQTDIANCGGCGINCAVANGVGSCDNGSCSITCSPGFNRCGSDCRLPDHDHCTSACTPCGPGMNCDTIPGSVTFNQCVSTITSDGGGPTCTNLMCNAICCDPADNKCCAATGCGIESDTNCGAACANCTTLGTGFHCSGGQCTGNTPGDGGVFCSPPKVPCPPQCATKPSCVAGCLDPSQSPTCGGDCQLGNDCTQIAGEMCCNTAAVRFTPLPPPSGGTGGNVYMCQVADAGSSCKP